MRALRWSGWAGLAAAVVVLLVGMLFIVGSAIAAGDWWLARQPWIGVGLTLLVIGLVGTASFALLLDVVEPLGWWRTAALPPTVFVAGFWGYVLVLGIPTTGGTEFDVATILYSIPEMMLLLVVATLLIALPLAIPRRRV